ncbi:TonB family protein [Paracidobacterium acidisoli]|uniref:TonB family protein n=1 Tax=Paracidobacterium acidisoli TaxID=2303751 RepID=A0A372IRA1_9BACT|nr:TonB family protein [Paracidobacterium acidisoli]MBT9330360.1 TonB family protein [Paracidobacterium acidisoli]
MPRNSVPLQSDPFGPPVAGSLLLHIAIAGALVLYIWLAGRLHGNEWGNNAPPGAIQATLVSSAPSIPLPQDTPPTPNVLATEQPSPAPAPPAPKIEPVPVPDAIPIPAKQPKVKLKEKKLQPPSPRHAQPVPNQRNRANYGEAQATQIPHATTGNPTPASPVNVNGGDFSSRFPWYVSLITRKVSEAWYRQEIDSATQYGSQVRVEFTISRDGTVHEVHISQPSASSTLNTSAVRAVQRVDSFGPLPNQYTGSTVSVEYTFTYDQPSR